LKFTPIAIPAMALLQQHDARRDIVIEAAARRRAAIEARGAFRTAGIRNRGHSELGAQSGRKNTPACLSVCLAVHWCISKRHGETSQNILYMLSGVVTRSFCDDSVLGYFRFCE